MAVTAKFTVLIDHREKRPFAVGGIRADARHGRQLVTVPTRRAHLATGDYTIEGMEAMVAVERKGIGDLYCTLGQSRARFQRELHRLAAMQFAAVVVEADWWTIIATPPPRSRLVPRTIFRSVIAWQQRFPRVHWIMSPGRDFAEVATYRVLERFWRDQQRKPMEGVA